MQPEGSICMFFWTPEHPYSVIHVYTSTITNLTNCLWQNLDVAFIYTIRDCDKRERSGGGSGWNYRGEEQTPRNISLKSKSCVWNGFPHKHLLLFHPILQIKTYCINIDFWNGFAITAWLVCIYSSLLKQLIGGCSGIHHTHTTVTQLPRPLSSINTSPGPHANCKKLARRSSDSGPKHVASHVYCMFRSAFVWMFEANFGVSIILFVDFSCIGVCAVQWWMQCKCCYAAAHVHNFFM